jgi:hypothetical protein
MKKPRPVRRGFFFVREASVMEPSWTDPGVIPEARCGFLERQKHR